MTAVRALPPVRVGLLGLVLVLGTLARPPGLFWAYKLVGTEVVTLHPDEPRYDPSSSGDRHPVSVIQLMIKAPR